MVQMVTRHFHGEAGIEDRAKVFHAFRHSFERMARDARPVEEAHDARTGHSGGGIVGRGYGNGFWLKALAEEMVRIEAQEAGPISKRDLRAGKDGRLKNN